jgi:non-canonical purine NTP pyrophosphatase (RdgB/HAM1 family)
VTAPSGATPDGAGTPDLVLVTGNAGKAREVERILGHPVDRVVLDLPEIQSVDVEEVVAHKARAAWEAVRRPVLVEDTGLYLAALDGLPGALVRWFVERVGAAGICALVPAGADRSATARTALGWCDGGDVRTFTGEVAGWVPEAPRGAGGFGWDSAFRPDGAPGTFAELGDADKDRHSMRRLALDAFRASPAGRPARL